MTDPGSFEPDWPRPAHVRAVMSTRQGGASDPPWHSLNLGWNVGDSPALVQRNWHHWRAQAGIPGVPQILRQVHGRDVLYRDRSIAQPPRADGHWTDRAELPLVVQAADCLPVLLCDSAGTLVAAVHAGWRGLLAGILRRAVAEMRAHLPARRSILAWVGPGIGPCHFETGAEVANAFLRSEAGAAACFVQRRSPDTGEARWHGDLGALAARQLQRQGVVVSRDLRCTVCASDVFFSYRRDGLTGRMSAAIWLSDADKVAEDRPALPESEARTSQTFPTAFAK